MSSQTIITKPGGRQLPFDEPRLRRYIDDIAKDFKHLEIENFKERLIEAITVREEYEAEKITDTMILEQLSQIAEDTPDWTFVAARTHLRRLYRQAAKNRSYDALRKYGDFYGLLKTLATAGIYDGTLLADYSREEINELGRAIDPSRDNLFTYIGLRTLSDRYLATDHSRRVYELPQERFMIISMHLMRKEDPSIRLDLVKEFYWACGNLFMTNATPTMSNAGKSYGQLSSCFIDTVDDSLDGIFLSNWDVARLSKDGGGIGVYLGKIRALGSDIKGFKGVASGVIPWMKQLNNTAVSVDQLGQRQGSIAVYLDVWHKDIPYFLDARLNNGDERMRTHDLFTGVCIPDLFMEKVADRGEWYLFDPHEVRKVMGWSLEDFYDEERGDGTWRKKYWECVNHPDLPKVRVEAIDIFKRIMKSQLESGTPYMFYRDTVNRANPNKHLGIIYCSNLCTEIMQNMSATTISEEWITTEDGDKVQVIKRKLGDFVVCNLSSINLGRAVPAGILDRLIEIEVRALDNVIDLNTIAVAQAQSTNEKYRAIGLGTFGWHHLLALKGIEWESEEAVKYCDELYEDIAYYAIKASHKLAIEKGAFPAFPGSEWNTGEYFVRRGYVIRDGNGAIMAIPGKERWYELCLSVMERGVRNGWIMAVAPNSSTSVIAGSTASIDPIFKKFYSEEKKNYKIPVTVPDLNEKTAPFYKSAYDIDQIWSVKQNAARQRHIDQSISFNIYVRNNIKASQLLSIHMAAWDLGLKTTYYVRSTAVEVDECESCSS